MDLVKNEVTTEILFMLSNKSFTMLMATLLASSAVFAMGGDDQYLCPKSINVTETAADIDKPWETSLNNSRGTYFLKEVRFYVGNPNENVNISPDDVTQIDKLRITTWNFSAKKSYWLACAYRNTTVLMTRRLPDGVTICQVQEKLSSPTGFAIGTKEITCR